LAHLRHSQYAARKVIFSHTVSHFGRILFMRTLFADLRYGLRLLRQAPAFTAIAICALALGIGANSAIFSTLDAVVLRPLPYRDPSRLVMVFEDSSSIGYPHNTPAPANYFDWKEQNHVFTDMAAIRYRGMSITGDGTPEQLKGQAVTPNLFSVLGVSPLLGRTFTEQEDRDGAQVVLISYRLWQSRYSGDPSQINKPIQLNGTRYNVIGVMPRDFVFRDQERDFWIPIHFTPADRAMRSSHYLTVVARLKPDATLDRARQEIASISRHLEQQYPQDNYRVGSVVVPIKEDLLGNTRVALFVLMAASGCVLLIACANLASLLLARAVARKKEMAVRAALGAGRGRLVRQMVTEATMLALAGGALGLLFAQAGMKILARLVPNGLPSTAKPSLDPALLLFTLALSLLTGLIFSVIPAVQAARASVNDALKQGGRSGADTRGRNTRDALVVLEVAAALVLLTGAGLMIQTMAKLRAIDLGFRSDHLLTMRTALGPKNGDAVKSIDYLDRVLSEVSVLPGVEGAGFASTLPFQSIGNTRGFMIDGGPIDQNYSPDALFRVGSTNYLATLGVKLLDGRLFTESDRKESAPVVIVNETLAHHYWPNGSAVGHHIAFGPKREPRTIVGVVADVQERGYDIRMKPGVYVPITALDIDWGPDSLIVRTKGDPIALVPSVRRAIASVDPSQPVSELRTMDEIVDLNVADRQQQMTLLGSFAALALVLASIGLYGVLSYSVTQRSREIGLRMAVGASALSVIRMIVARGLALTALGLALGLGAAFLATRALKNLLFGVAATDPFTFASVAALLGIIALIACWAPARRASRVDPITVLREE
jgi:putative ABC transport system permease protein